jgi:preprotein translocase subunit SecB
MSVKVDLDQLAGALSDFTFAYLITVSDDHRAHALAVDPVLEGGVFTVATVGNSTRRNLADRTNVTLLFPPLASGGFTLIVDGRGELGDALRVVPSHAVLHRPA